MQASSDFVEGCAQARVEPSVARHVGLMFHGIGPEASEYRASRNLSRQASGAMPRDAMAGSIKPTSTSCSLAHDRRHDALNDTGK